MSYTDEFITEKNSSSNYLQHVLDFHTPKPAWGYISTPGLKHTNAHTASTLSRKSFWDSSVKRTHDADVIQIASIEQKNHTESIRVNERNLAEKNNAAGFMNVMATAESANVIVSKVAEKDISTEDDNIKQATGESISLSERSVYESNVAEKKLTSGDDCISGVTTAGSDLVRESSITEKKRTSYGSCMSAVTIAELELVSESKVIEKKHVSSGACASERSQVLQKKEEIEAFLQKQPLAVSTKGSHQEILAKKTLNNAKKSTEAASASCKKMKSEHSGDTCDILAKVMDYHSRGALQSLTVPDLKAFLTTKKAKVGGKKEELIQRATTFLA